MPDNKRMNFSEVAYVVEVMRPDRDEWLLSRVFDSREDAEATVRHAESGKKPWVARTVKFYREDVSIDDEQKGP